MWNTWGTYVIIQEELYWIESKVHMAQYSVSKVG